MRSLKLATARKGNQQLQSSQTASSSGGSPRQHCPATEPLEEYLHLAIDFIVHQFFITGRDLGIDLGVDSNEAFDRADNFHHVSAYKFEERGEPGEDLPKKKYVDASGYRARLTTVDRLSIRKPVYTEYYKSGSDNDFNDSLGRALAVHLSRTKIYTNDEEGDFQINHMVRQAGFLHTDKLAMKLFVYVKFKLNGQGQAEIYKIKDGKISDQISSDQYKKLRSIQSKDCTYGEWDAMPLIPGVYQVHALIVERGGSFYLTEVYCDGDCIFPDSEWNPSIKKWTLPDHV